MILGELQPTEVEFISSKDTHNEKCCNSCGEMVKVYCFWRNAPICKTCAPLFNLIPKKEEKPKKEKIPSEGDMVDRLLKDKKQKKL